MSLDIPMTFNDGLDHEPNAFSILIVDSDSDDARHLVQTILAPRGYKTTIVRTGRRALVAIRQKHIDLILLSWHLVDMEGAPVLQVCRKFEKQCLIFKFVSDTPVHSGQGESIIEHIRNYRGDFCQFIRNEVITILNNHP